jgi:hypothetical protein
MDMGLNSKGIVSGKTLTPLVNLNGAPTLPVALPNPPPRFADLPRLIGSA